MSQTRPNGIVVPINSDAYNLTADLATMADKSNVTVVCVNQAARDALTLYAGLTVWRQDTNALQTYNGSIWSTLLMGDTGWLDFTVFGNGFTPFTGNGYVGAKYRLLGNTVHVNGAATNGGSYASGVAICAIPAGFVPARKVIGVNCIADIGANILTLTAGSAGAVSFSVSYPLG